jgi:hypothetical protein
MHTSGGGKGDDKEVAKRRKSERIIAQSHAGHGTDLGNQQVAYSLWVDYISNLGVAYHDSSNGSH